MGENNIVALLGDNEMQNFLGCDPSQFCFDHIFDNGSTLLSLAVKSGNLQNVKTIVNKRADVNKRETGGATPLLLAVYLNHLDIVKFLVQKGASVNLGDSYETPLMLATRKGHLTIIEYLVENGAKVNILNIENISPIFWAIRQERLAVLECLITKGGIPKSTNPLMYAIAGGGSKEIIQCLLKHGAEINESPLAWAAKNSRLDIVKLLIQYGADSNQIGIDGNTPLATATRYQRLDIVKFLINLNVNVCKVGKNGKTPLLWAIENEDLDIVKYLLHHGSVYIIDSVFLAAIATKNLEVVQFLHQKGAYKNKKYTINEVTPLAKSLQVESYEIAKYLLESGATLDDLEDNDVLYLLKFLEKKNYQMVHLLTGNGTRLDRADPRIGHTPLSKSIEMEDFEMVRYFVQNGADVNQLNAKKKSPLAVAAEVGNFSIFQFLVEKGADMEKDPLKDNETMIRYYEIAKENISKTELICLGYHEEADEVKAEADEVEAVVEENSTCEEEVKEKSLAERSYYVIEFD